MKSSNILTAGLSVLLVTAMVFSAFAVVFTDDSDASISKATKDAAGNDLDETYNTSRIMTVGVGTLRWVAYFGETSKVVCIDAGDANKASWNGKAYRSLFTFDGTGLASQMSGSSINPAESHITTYGMACHDHNGFSTANLEALNGWTSKPTVSIISKTVYNGFSNETKTGLSAITKIVVIEEVDSFMDANGNLSAGFNTNLSILARVFNNTTRADAIVKTVSDTVADIKDLIDGKTAKFSAAYVGSASNAGAKGLSWSVGDYIPFNLAGVKNGYDNDSSTATDAGSEAMSKANPKVIFLDLSGTAKYSDSTSEGVLSYASLNSTPMYTILPYFWFGFNFDNALADAYLVIYACYDDVLSYDDCMAKIRGVYKAFYPEMSDGKTATDGFDSYYSASGSKLTLDGQAYNYVDGNFVKVDRPQGDVEIPSDDKKDNTPLIIGGAVVVVVVLLAGAVLIMRKR